ncbi:hypothetical protein A2777_06670 [Candidatus Gottesmanbacteria bacterium RIFCSPHIGHO2_01_FULL_40_15]|uniref:Uncharacterized protein n=1 Tax=Candidatus Gottesmanbacteria bacterium RIFCSPHIGHO2_01_FULL_40_15 TaxID=1798376 RepID=A0A1F5Z1K9_9BACT|nr:MAG: hypothetical protein A2777_06670 [Candidatus Gottesmanbacteria bacterium RIFCSPHIGHO2_01_FULL_40_15]
MEIDNTMSLIKEGLDIQPISVSKESMLGGIVFQRGWGKGVSAAELQEAMETLLETHERAVNGDPGAASVLEAAKDIFGGDFDSAKKRIREVAGQSSGNNR